MKTQASKSSIYIFLVICFLTFLLRLIPILHNNIAFTSDQARDMLDIRSLVVGHQLKFIGPITDIIGVFLGPFWYYFNAIPFLLGNGNPVYLVWWQIVWYHLAAIIFFFVLKKSHPRLSFTV